MSKIKNYINETVTEMTQNVTWPTWKELQANAIVVVVAALIFAVAVSIMDQSFGIASFKSWKGVMGIIYGKQ